MKKNIFFAGLLFFLCPCALLAESDSASELTSEQARGLYSLLENIEGQKSLFPEEVNANNLYELIDVKYKMEDVLIAEDNSSLILPGSILLTVYRKSAVISFEAFFSDYENFDSSKALRIVNEWNKEHVFSTASWRDTYFVLSYYMTFAGGVHADNLNETIDWFYAMYYGFGEFLVKETTGEN